MLEEGVPGLTFSGRLEWKKGFLGGASGKESTCNAGDLGSGSGKIPGGGNGYPLHYSCLENFMDRGAWQTTVYRVEKELDTTEHQVTESSFPCHTWSGSGKWLSLVQPVLLMLSGSRGPLSSVEVGVGLCDAGGQMLIQWLQPLLPSRSET